MQLGRTPARHVSPEGKTRGPPVLFLHGVGLGAWIWERDQAIFAEAGFQSYAVDLPGHGDQAGQDATLEDLVEAVVEACRALGEPACIVGHSVGGLIAQVVAGRLPVHSLVLIAPTPPADVRFFPTREGVRAALGHLPALATGRPLRMREEDYVQTTLHVFPEGERAAIAARVTPWPNSLVRDILTRRPAVPVNAVGAPVLVTFGFQDKLMRLSTVRLVGDRLGAVTWRFDDLAHLPMLEPGGERHARKVIGFIRHPKRRRIDEVDAMAPAEGVGQTEREDRRGGRRTRTRLEGQIRDGRNKYRTRPNRKKDPVQKD